MTEQERIVAIDALSEMILEHQRPGYQSYIQEEDREALRHSTVGILRNMNERDMLEGYNIYSHILQKHWIDATPEEALICENAAHALREVIEGEKG